MSFTVVSSNLGVIRRSSASSPLISKGRGQERPSIRPVLLASFSPYSCSQCRTFWRGTRHNRSIHDEGERILQRMHEYQHHCLSILRRKTAGNNNHHHQQWTEASYNRHPWRWCRFKSSSSSSSSSSSPGGPHRHNLNNNDWQYSRSFWEIERARRQQWIEQLKKEIEKDPYTVLFGKRLDPFDYRDVRHGSWSDICRVLLGLNIDRKGPGAKSMDTTATSTSRSTTSKDTSTSSDMRNEDGHINDNKYPSSEVSMSGKGANDAQQTVINANAEVFEFDPISGRMVPVAPKKVDVAGGSERRENGQSVKATRRKKKGVVDTVETADEPMESSKPSQRSSPSDSQSSKLQDKATTTEPAGSFENQSEKTQDAFNSPITLISSTPEVLEGADPNTFIKPGPKSKNRSTPESNEQYENMLTSLHEQEKSEDLDLLRASDIRASYDSRKTKQERDAQKQDRRKALQEDFASYKDPVNDILAEEIRASFQSQNDLKSGNENVDESRTGNSDDLHHPVMQSLETSREDGQQQIGSSFSGRNDLQPVKSAKDKPADIHERLVQTSESSTKDQKPEIQASFQSQDILKLETEKVAELPIPTNAHQTTPHSLEPSTTDQNPMKDEIADSPLQPTSQSLESEASSSSNASSSPTTTYRILAYDSSTFQVTTAETTSSLYTTHESLHPTEVLSRLNNPAKFLPYFAEMQRNGYEIVSGGGDILVFKKTRDVIAATQDVSKSSDKTKNLPGDIIKEEAKYKSESGDKITETDQPSIKQHPRLVHRQETVYTGGPPNWSPYPPPPSSSSLSPEETIPSESQPKLNPKKEGVFRKTLRRMFFTGVATAATCYAIGVVCEYFRTGGKDGRGIDAFTAFESERRQHERELRS